MAVKIRYNDTTIATVEPDKTKMLECADKEMQSNIVIDTSLGLNDAPIVPSGSSYCITSSKVIISDQAYETAKNAGGGA